MKKSVVAWSSAVIVAAAVLALSSSLFVASGSQTGKTGKDVVMMRCDTTTAAFKTTGYHGKSGTPSKRSGQCSENLSQLMKDGFVIRDIGHYDMEKAGYVVITMVR